ncbi:RING-H2 finger protein ATL66-like [Miscanthus floridulus]|uniref:RING-H2 finger protein ATL66-like n=1 Tax=Miscanthus floridulus TaxID=154761 RepID=UPI003458D278
MVPPGGAAAALHGNPPSPAASRTNGYAYESRVLIALLLASALMFFLTYQLFGPAAATAVVVLFLVFALAAHRVRISRSFPFLHLSLPAGSAHRRWFRPAAGTAEPGMDAAAISALPAAFGYKREHAATGWAQCAICLGLVAVGEAVRRLPTCGHLFHAGCIDQWLRAHATCPMCRAAVGAAVPELPV